MEEERVVKEILSPALEERGYELVSVRFYRSKEGPKLEVTVDRPEPISLDDIVALSDVISPLLDEHDPIEGAYTLDISSAGAEKEIGLEKLDAYVGRYVHLHLSHPYKGENILEGDLKAIDEENVTLTLKIKAKTVDIVFPRKDVDKARLAIKF